jgi:RimJ/RimL family protein N-acetyltransferase
MDLRPLESADISLVAGWLSQTENYQWLDFGNNIHMLPPALLNLMSQNEKHCLRLYSVTGREHPIGLVALTNIDKHFKTALLWYVLGDKTVARQGQTREAVSKLLGTGFKELGLRSISAWAVEANHPSIRVLEKNGVHYIGRQPSCHMANAHISTGNDCVDWSSCNLIAVQYGVETECLNRGAARLMYF